MNKIKDLSRNPDIEYKCDICDTMISTPGLCRECKEKDKKKNQ